MTQHPINDLRNPLGKAFYDLTQQVEALGGSPELTAVVVAIGALRDQVGAAVQAAQPGSVGEVLFDEKFGCKAGQLFVDLPVGTALYAAITQTQQFGSEREAFEKKLKEQWPHADYTFEADEYTSAAVQCAWAAWMWRAAAPTEAKPAPKVSERRPVLYSDEYAKPAQDAVDAERYRVIRDWGASFMDDQEKPHHVCEAAMDAVIDAARAKKGG